MKKAFDLEFNLPREPRSTLDFLRLVGFVKWFDWIFLAGLVASPFFAVRSIYVFCTQDSIPILLMYVGFVAAWIAVYVLWCCCLLGRLLYFSLRCLAKLSIIQEALRSK